MDIALKYFSVYLLSGLKFIFGPTLGVTYELPVPVIIILTSCGMMTTIYLFTFFGDEIRKFIRRFQKKDRRLFTKRSRQFVRVWRKFGLKGVCLITPLILTPPGGGLLINLLGSKKSQILKWMWISALLWSTTVTLIVKYAYWMIESFID